jgi:aryl-alcohol dehydrogenase-like predicted oxidoreductase
MQYQQLGNTGVFVSKLCLGAMTFGGGEGSIFRVIGGLGQGECDALVGRCLDAGINFIDTANIYAEGESETIVGKALGSRRQDVVVATKALARMGPGANQVGLSRLHLMQAVEASLKRLNTDYIDLYQIHGFDSLTPLEETLSALNDLVRQGKVRYIGCSNLAAWQVMKSFGVSAANYWEKFVSLQAYYSLVGRELERELVPMLLDQKIGLLVWSPLAGGFLSGKYTRNAAPEGESRRKTFTFPPVHPVQGFDVVEALQNVAARRNSTVAGVALAWLLHQPVVTSVIIGARNQTQLNDNLAAVDVKLDADDLKLIDEASKLTPEYPGWMLAQQNSARRPGEKRDWTRFAKAAGEK